MAIGHSAASAHVGTRQTVPLDSILLEYCTAGGLKGPLHFNPPEIKSKTCSRKVFFWQKKLYPITGEWASLLPPVPLRTVRPKDWISNIQQGITWSNKLKSPVRPVVNSSPKRWGISNQHNDFAHKIEGEEVVIQWSISMGGQLFKNRWAGVRMFTSFYLGCTAIIKIWRRVRSSLARFLPLWVKIMAPSANLVSASFNSSVKAFSRWEVNARSVTFLNFLFQFGTALRLQVYRWFRCHGYTTAIMFFHIIHQLRIIIYL